jgi:collagen type III alpha
VVSADRASEGTGGRAGAGAPLGDSARGGAGACSTGSADDVSGSGGGSSSNSVVGWHGVGGDGRDNTSGNGALRGDRACGGAGACIAGGEDDVSGFWGGSFSHSVAGWHGVDGDGGSGGEGGEQHPSICGICLFLDKTAIRLLARVASLSVLTLFLGGGAG